MRSPFRTRPIPEPDTQRAGVWTDSLGRAGSRSAQVILILLLAVGAVYAMIQLKLVVVPVLIALILASAMSPLVGYLRRRNMPRMLATWIALIATVVVFGGIITGIVFAVRAEWPELIIRATTGLDELQRWLFSLPLPIDEQQLEEAWDSIVGFLTSAEFGSGALAGVSAVGEFLTGTVLTLVILFFFLKDGDRMWAFLIQRLRGDRLAKARRSGVRTVEVLGVYVRGTSIVAAVDAIVIGIALAILQVPLALPLSVIVFIGAFIPLIGATLAGVLAALVALVANGPIIALIVVAVVIAVNQLEGDLLQPVVLGRSLKLHALVILLALTIGTILGGILGAVLSVPVAAVSWAVVKIWAGADEPALTASVARR
ncbi:MAG: AI-2E family transporter [Microbacteriaceae bacterium]